MSEIKIPINRPSSAASPPNCAICLGNCTNKCFSDSCLHEFCFRCLLEWSKIKAECPLCKQPFKSIIHNVKSNEDYDEHVVETPRNEEVRLEDVWFLPVPITPQRHEFHVRTTFTVDSRGEHAIQQMLLSHPLTAGGRITVNAGIPTSRSHGFSARHRRDYSATSFRRSLYAQNLWVDALPDLTGRYRDCSPVFFRNNPGARQRLVPWLNRELNAILFENTQLIMHLVDLIMERLLSYHICSRAFRNLLREYLDSKTDQFVHEFYSFMRSPFDMIGYDRNVMYSSRPQSPAPILEDDTVEVPDFSDEDSDVVLIGETRTPEPVTINLIESNSDSDDEPIMVSGQLVPLPLPAPNCSPPPEVTARAPSPVSVANLPPKLRYKHLCLSEKRYRWTNKTRHSWSSSSNSSQSGSQEQHKNKSYKKYKKRLLLNKLARRRILKLSDSSTEVEVTSESDTDDNKPLIDIVKEIKHKKSKKDRKRKRHESYTLKRDSMTEGNSSQLYPIDLSASTSMEPMGLDLSLPSCSRYPSTSSNSNRFHIGLPKTRSTVELSNNGQYTSVQIETSDTYEPSTSKTKIKIVSNGHNSPQHSRDYGTDDSSSSTEPYKLPSVRSEIKEVKVENPGPSTSKAKPLVLRRDRDKWYTLCGNDSSD
ncbi:uncharacterized protein LOC109532721 isoform X2 [Dendroctonus ponderosae]|uniref:E3 ubiquitin-protein ligase Topors n=1 Tax=Dendroctonus ponderosae TaxID=77166 RepID=A0AAR5NXG5_DENPD|nr:uncharacterized protein LOC109532721 isoform X2 [Dendroctonus ponderosae]